jgi:hypothetical protein
MVPVTTFVYLLINFVYFFDNFLREDIFPTFRTRMLPAGLARMEIVLLKTVRFENHAHQCFFSKERVRAARVYPGGSAVPEYHHTIF